MFTQRKRILIGKISTSDKELIDLGKAWAVIAVAFGIVLNGGISGNLIASILIAFVTVGTGFLLHELAHKLVAQRYGCVAEFRSFDQFLLLTLGMSFFGFVFAAPGAVMILGRITKKENGIISVAGPITNIVLALAFYAFMLTTSEGFLNVLAFYGLFINAWLALFNMLPFWNFDGAKIWKWNKTVYFSVVAISFLLMIIAQA